MINTKNGLLISEGIATGASAGTVIGSSIGAIEAKLINAVIIRLSAEYRSFKRIYNQLMDLKIENLIQTRKKNYRKKWML